MDINRSKSQQKPTKHKKTESKYQEGNNRPPSAMSSIVHRHKKAGNKCQHSRQPVYSGNSKCVNRFPGRLNVTCCGHAPAVYKKYNQSYLVF